MVRDEALGDGFVGDEDGFREFGAFVGGGDVAEVRAALGFFFAGVVAVDAGLLREKFFAEFDVAFGFDDGGDGVGNGHGFDFGDVAARAIEAQGARGFFGGFGDFGIGIFSGVEDL